MIELHQKELSNGLRVVIAPNHKAPVVNLSIAYRVGSKDEDPRHTGLAHLFEHLMFDNIENEDGMKFDALLTLAGGESNAYTTYDYTLYHMSVPSTQVELAAWLESQRLSRFGISQSALDTQISVVSEEILQTVKNRPYGEWRDLQSSVGYDESCMYHWEVIGSREHVQSTTLDDARAWYNRFYRPNNAVLVLSGDITAERAFALVDQYFAPIDAKSTGIQRRQFSAQQRRSGAKDVRRVVPFDAVFRSYHFEGFNNDESLAADLLSSIMSDGQSSRLYRAMQYDNQIATDAGCYPDKREYSSLLTFYAFAASPDISAEQLNEALMAQINRLCSDGISREELHKAQNKLRTALAYELQTSTGIADSVAQQTMFWNDPERINALMDKYLAVTAEQIVDFARRTCQEQNEVKITILADESSDGD